MANYERRRSSDWDWSDENNSRNRNSGNDRDYANDRDFYNQYPRRDFNQDYENDRMNTRRGQSSNTDYDNQSDYGSSRGSGYGRDRDYGRDYGSSGQNFSDRGFRAGGNADYYGRNSSSDYDRNSSNQGNFQGRNSGYDRDYGYQGQGSNFNDQGRNSSSWSGSDSGQGSRQGRNWGGGQNQNWNGNQSQNWGSNQGNFQSGQGEHYGRGPQGYKRSDDRIKEDINDRLTWHGNVDATNIQVTVKSGEVTLDGTVSDRNQKRMAEDVAEQVQGVTDVQNHLRVQNDDTNQSSRRSSGSQSTQKNQPNEQSSLGQVPNGKPKERSNN